MLSKLNIFFIFIFILFLGCIGQTDEQTITNVSVQTETNSYSNITPQQLEDMLENEEIFLVDVHIPEQEHINGTDLFTPYNDIDLSEFPEDKDAKIVVYCRSGSMSQGASQQLIDAGYKNVYNLEGGTNAWKEYLNSANSINEEMEEMEKDEKQVALEEKVAPSLGIELPITWGHFWPTLVEEGVINIKKINYTMKSYGGLSDEQLSILLNGSDEKIKITPQNSRFIVNVFWALGLANKNPILDEGPIATGTIPIKNYASVGGWTLGNESGYNYFSKFELINLTPEQQEVVEGTTKNIYRPCCNNEAYYPDCNHGMAILGVAEYMASQNMTEDQIYDVALVLNSYWFSNVYGTTYVYFESKNISWDEVDAKEVLGYNYSSSAGWLNTKKIVDELPDDVYYVSSGAGCGA